MATIVLNFGTPVSRIFCTAFFFLFLLIIIKLVDNKVKRAADVHKKENPGFF